MIAALIGVDFTTSGPEETSSGEYVYRADAEKVIAQLEAALISGYHELVGGGDYLGDKLMTAQDKINYMIARVPK